MPIVLLCIVSLVVFMEAIDLFFSIPPQLSSASQDRGIVNIYRLKSLFFRIPIIFIIFGISLLFTGSIFVSIFLSSLIGSLLLFGSRLKYNLLGEPLMFCDVAVVGAFIRHPRFYVGAIPKAARAVLITAFGVICLFIAGLFVLDVLFIRSGTGLEIRIAGFLTAGLSWIFLESLRYFGLARRLLPQADMDVGLLRYGLLATIALGWMRWKEDRITPLPSWPVVPERSEGQGPIIVIVQCESFADPQDLGLSGVASCVLESLARNRDAGAVGELDVSGFGAYTMRAEYGVLFGHEESTLGFRRFDPYLTALGQMKEALPARLFNICQNRIFVHPHDLTFYGRNCLMPAAGFSKIIGSESFSKTALSGTHIEDRSVGDYLVNLIEDAAIAPGGTLLFTVTIENHGPWRGGLPEYLKNLVEGDVLLGRLGQALEEAGREALLVFYGDHRPSLPGVVMPKGARHTPVVMRGFGDLKDIPRLKNKKITPASLHHEIINIIFGDCSLK